MRKAINRIMILLVLSGVQSCKKDLNSADYVRYITNTANGLRKTTEVGGLKFTLQYRPYDYILLMENLGHPNPQEMDKRKKDLAGTAWFSIILSRVDQKETPLRYGVASLDEYNARLDYYLNEAKKDVWLKYGEITIRPTSYLFENNYNLTPDLTMIVGFMLPAGERAPDKAMQLSYNDPVFRSGIVKASFPVTSIKDIPNLVYKN